jgi:hypothetical protein
VIAAALLALLAGGQEWSAQWELDRVNNVVLVVTHDGKKHVIKEGRWAPLETHRFRSVSGNGKVRFQGRTYIGKGGQIIDLNSGKSLDMPHPQAPPTGGIGVFRSKGGLALRDRMFWIFSWDNVDQMFEPPIQAFAYEVFARDGALRVGRTTELHTLTKYDGVIGGWHGYIPILSGSSLAIVAGSQFVEFDLAAFRVRSTMKEHVHVAPSGAIYRSDGHRLVKWSFEERDWQLVRNPLLGNLTEVSTLGNDDLLIFADGLMLASSGRSYRFPITEARSRRFFLDPNFGIGIILGDVRDERAPAVFLGRNLQPLCTIAPLRRR